MMRDEQPSLANVTLSMTKAKKHGWFGSVDSYESMLGVVNEFIALKIIPDPDSIVAKAS